MSSNVIDDKVVEMRFDNRQFEANVKTSLNTIDKLKQSLNFSNAAKGFDQITQAANKVSFAGLKDQVDDLDSYLNLKTMAMFTVVSNIVTKIQTMISNMIKEFTIVPVSTGFNEYELKMGSVQTIMAATGETLEVVNGYLEELNHYADKTIYSFSDMTQNIGKFTNAGVKLEDAVLAMKGISNEAAVSGANANEASRAMYNLAQSLSMGYVQYIDWKSIENANMATVEFKKNLADMAVELGVVKKVGDDLYDNGKSTYNLQQLFKDGLKDQWLTTEVLINTLRDYADEETEIGKKAYAAAQDVKTFSMMMDTLKEAAQSGWAQTWEIILGDFNEAKSMFTKFSEIFGGMIDRAANARNKLIKSVMESNWEKLTGKIKSAGIATEEFEKALIDTFEKHDIPIVELMEQYGSLEEVLHHGFGDVTTYVTEALERFMKPMTELSDITETTTEKLEEFQDVVNKVIRGEFGNGIKRYEELTDAGYDFAVVQKLVNTVWERNGRTWKNTEITMEDLANVMGDLTDEELKQMGVSEDQIDSVRLLVQELQNGNTEINEWVKNLGKKSGRVLLIESLHNIVKSIGQITGIIKDAWTYVFPVNAEEELRGIIEALHAFTEWLIMDDDTAEKLKMTLKGVFSVFGLITDLIQGILRIFFPKLLDGTGKLGDKLLDITARWGEGVVAFREWVHEGNLITKSLEWIYEMFESGINIFKGWYNAFKENEKVASILQSIGSVFSSFVNFWKDLWNSFYNDIVDENISFGEALVNLGKNFATAVSTFLKSIPVIGWVAEGLFNIIDAFKEIGGNTVSGFISGIWKGIKAIPGVIMSFVDTVIGTAKKGLDIHSPSKVFEKIGSYVIDGFIIGLLNGFNKLVTKIQTLISNMTNVFIKKYDENSPIVAIIKGLESGTVKTLGLVKFLTNKVIDIMKFFKNQYVQIIQAIFDVLSEIDWENVYNWIYRILRLLLVYQEIKAVKNIGNAFSDIGEGFKEIANSISGALKSFSSNNATNTMKEFVKCILLLTGAVLILSHFGGDNLLTAADILMKFIVILGLFWTVNNLIANLTQKKVKFNVNVTTAVFDKTAQILKAIGTALLGVVSSIFIVVTAVKYIDWVRDTSKDFKGSLSLIAVIFTVLVGTLIVLLRLSKKYSSIPQQITGDKFIFSSSALKGIGNAIMSMSLSLLIVVKAIEMLAKLLSNEDPNYVDGVKKAFWRIIGLLVVMGAVLSGITLAAGAFKVGTIKLSGLALSMLSMAASLFIIVNCIKSLGEIIGKPGTDTAIDVIVRFLIVIGLIGVALVGITKISNPASVISSAAVILSFTLALHIITQAILSLNNITLKSSTIFTILAIMASIIAAMYVAISIAGWLPEGKIINSIASIASMLIFAIALGGLLQIVYSIAKKSNEKIINRMWDVLKMLGIITLCVDSIALISGTIGKTGWTTVLALDGMILSLSILMYVIGELTQNGETVERLKTILLYLGIFTVVIGGVITLFGTLANSALPGLIGIALVVGAIGILIGSIADLIDAISGVYTAFNQPINYNSPLFIFILTIKKMVDDILEGIKKAYELINEFGKKTAERNEKIIEHGSFAFVPNMVSDTSSINVIRYLMDIMKPVSKIAWDDLKNGKFFDFPIKKEYKAGEEAGESFSDGFGAGLSKKTGVGIGLGFGILNKSNALESLSNFFSSLGEETGNTYTDEYVESLRNLDYTDIANTFYENVDDKMVSNIPEMSDTLSGVLNDASLDSVSNIEYGNMAEIFKKNISSAIKDVIPNDNNLDILSLLGINNKSNKTNIPTKVIKTTSGATGMSSPNNDYVVVPNVKYEGNELVYGDIVRSLNNSNDNEYKMYDLLNGLTNNKSFNSTLTNSIIQTQSDDVCKAISELKTETRSLGDRISRLYVMLDTGALVGHLTPQINNAFGRMAVYSERGN